MRTDKEDTDPSSPSALRPRPSSFSASSPSVPSASGLPSVPSVPSAANVNKGAMPGEAPSLEKPTTDPGLGPPTSSPPTSGGRQYGVVVPPPSLRPTPASSAVTPPEFRPIVRRVSAASLHKDSVELLLEGMAGPRPDRRKTTPQSDGEASAAYHGEHGLRPARPSSEPGPKVVVDRVPSVARREPPVEAGPVVAWPASREALSTFVPGRVARRRVAMAVLAGALIVFLSFVGLRLASTDRESTERPSSGSSGSTEATGEAPVAAAVPTSAAPVHTGAPVPAAAPVDPAMAAAEASKAEERVSPHTSASGPPRHHHGSGEASSAVPTPTPTPTPAAPAAGDLGEFKSKF